MIVAKRLFPKGMYIKTCFQLDSGEDIDPDSDSDQEERVGSSILQKRYMKQDQVSPVLLLDAWPKSHVFFTGEICGF